MKIKWQKLSEWLSMMWLWPSIPSALCLAQPVWSSTSILFDLVGHDFPVFERYRAAFNFFEVMSVLDFFNFIDLNYFSSAYLQIWTHHGIHYHQNLFHLKFWNQKFIFPFLPALYLKINYPYLLLCSISSPLLLYLIVSWAGGTWKWSLYYPLKFLDCVACLPALCWHHQYSHIRF